MKLEEVDKGSWKKFIIQAAALGIGGQEILKPGVITDWRNLHHPEHWEVGICRCSLAIYSALLEPI